MSRLHLSNIICHIILHNNKTLKWFIALIWYSFKILFSPLCSIRWDEQNYTSLAYVFLKINWLIAALNLHRSFIPAESTAWIFFIFQPSKICVSLTDVISSIFPPRCRLSSDRYRHAAVPCHDFFPLSSDELTVSVSSSDNALSHRILELKLNH
jgi:hypothetical protein